MFEKITPEQAGVSSKQVAKFISLLERRGATTHGILMMKNGKIFAENYWKPFHKDFCHRMYSQTKSYVGIAIGLLQEEGKLNINDRIIDYFPEKIDGKALKYHDELTIKEMLTMSTAGGPRWWFTAEDGDRTHLYFNDERGTRPSGTLFQYDSAGSQVLCALVEKLSGKKLLDYMKEKLFNRMGTFQTAEVLQTRNGDSWGDSALVCTLRDMASFAQLLMNGGVWEGERLINEAYVREATSRVVDTRESSYYKPFYCAGYGYQIWRVERNGFAFNGMGGQMTFCYPDQQVIFTITSDNQGDDGRCDMFTIAFQEMILDEMQAEPLPADAAAEKLLAETTADLKLRSVQGAADSPFRKELDGVTYECEENPMGITKFSFHFKDEKTGELRYTNEQGDKVLPFGVNHNEFGHFPEFGYDNDRGGTPTTDGFTYRDAVSFAWVDEKKIVLSVQVIDRYFGRMSAVFGFKGEHASVHFSKAAEHFFQKYDGWMTAHRK